MPGVATPGYSRTPLRGWAEASRLQGRITRHPESSMSQEQSWRRFGRGGNWVLEENSTVAHHGLMEEGWPHQDGLNSKGGRGYGRTSTRSEVPSGGGGEPGGAGVAERSLGQAHALAAEVRAAHHQAAPTMGVMGDSLSDEYRFYPPDRSQARNWVELLGAKRIVNFGAFSMGSRGEPRNAGFADNWARSDATTSDMLGNQVPGLLGQVRSGRFRW